MSRREIIKIIEPQLSYEGDGIQWFRSLTPADAEEAQPFVALDMFHAKGANPEKPYLLHRFVQELGLFSYILYGNYSIRLDSKQVFQANAGDFVAFSSGVGIKLEEVFLPVNHELEGFRLWIKHPKNENISPEVKINPVNSRIFLNNHSVLINVFTGSAFSEGLEDDHKFSDLNIMNVSMNKNSNFVWNPPESHKLLIFVYQGRGFFGPYQTDEVLIQRYRVLLYGNGAEISVRTEDTPLRFMIATVLIDQKELPSMIN